MPADLHTNTVPQTTNSKDADIPDRTASIPAPSGSPAIVDVWKLDLDLHADRAERYRNLLAPAERERAERGHASVRRRFLCARGSLRCLLAHYSNASPAGLVLEYDHHGKPRLAGTEAGTGWSFNLTHSGNQALLSIGWSLDLGVDLEIHRPMHNLAGLAERILAPSELACWSSLDEPHKPQAFFDYWVCKEAFVKAVGQGLSLGLSRCVVSLADPPGLTAVPASCGLADEWSLCRLPLGAGRSAALCARTRAVQAKLLEFPLDGFGFADA